MPPSQCQAGQTPCTHWVNGSLQDKAIIVRATEALAFSRPLTSNLVKHVICESRACMRSVSRGVCRAGEGYMTYPCEVLLLLTVTAL